MRGSPPPAYNLGRVLEIFHSRGYGPVLFFFIIPSLQPIPLPGLGSIFGIFVAILGLAMMFAMKPRLPRKLAEMPIQNNSVRLICNGCRRLFGILEKLVRPRLTFLVTHQAFRFLNGLLVFAAGLLLTLPLVLPFSNFVPALLVLLICLGLLEDDGLMILLAYLYTIILAVVFSIYGPMMVEYLNNFFSNP